LNALYPPAKAFTHPKDSTIVCRCEEVSAGEIRDAVKMGAQGPNQLKAFLRSGMGPCQGRICADMTAAIIAQSKGKKVGEVEPMRVRMPISPVTLGEMASSDD
jgi:bacterioferritin-associated ferredoxin